MNWIDLWKMLIMNYQTLMVHLKYGQSNEAVFNAAKQISNYETAAVIGIMAEQQTQMIYGRGYATLDFFDREQANLKEKIAFEEVTFNAAFKQNKKSVEWRSHVSMDPASDFIVLNACCADLIITGVAATDFYEGPNSAHAGAIVMQAGRPVLAVPVAKTEFTFNHILVGWKDTREARRAIIDALPLLKMATLVTILEIIEKDDQIKANEHLQQIVNWLKTHDIEAKPLVVISTDADAIEFLNISEKLNPDIVVIGAYGHSRFREWVLGGVTNELLQSAKYCLLLSH